jgi:hypothetical protein
MSPALASQMKRATMEMSWSWMKEEVMGRRKGEARASLRE